MLNAIISRYIQRGRGLHRGSKDLIDFRRVGVSQQYRAGLRIDGINLINAVVFFYRAGEFVFANPVSVVIGYRRASHQAGLLVFAHNQAVSVITRRVITD